MILGSVSHLVRRLFEDGIAPSAVDASVDIEPLRQGTVVEAASVLAGAFRTEAFVSTAVSLSSERDERALTEAFDARLRTYRAANQPVFTASEQGTIVGVAVVKRPDVSISTLRFLASLGTSPRALAHLLGRVDPVGVSQVLGTLSPPEVVPADSYTLETIAVEPAHQGEGIGELLLDAIDDLVERDPGASGTYLATAESSNRDLYEQFGYQTVATKQVGDFTAYHMFRPNENGTHSSTGARSL